MRILFLSYYYEPDLSAGSFRNTALVKELRDQLPEGSEIDVITTSPSRYASYKVTAPSVESSKGVIVHRIAIDAASGSLFSNLIAFTTYFKVAVKRSKLKKYDLVFASSSRLLTASLGAYLSRRLDLPLYLDIRDLFVDTIKDVLPRPLAWISYLPCRLLESWTFCRADRINLVSEGFRDYIEKKHPGKDLAFFYNGIDEIFLKGEFTTSTCTDCLNNIKVLYAGNIGEGQGIHKILPVLAKRLQEKVDFTVIGDGGKKIELERRLRDISAANVEIKPPVSRKELIREYKKADVLFLHLNEYNVFNKVLPSKIFEYAATGKPIWAGVSGFARVFIQEKISNTAVFEPCDVGLAEKSLNDLEIKLMDRADFKNQYSRSSITKLMAKDIISLTSNAY